MPPPNSLGGDPINPPNDVASYPRELYQGQIEEWMNFKAARLVATAFIAYNGALDENTRALFKETVDINGVPHPAAKVRVEFEGTDATHGVKTKTEVSGSTGEPVPSGMAEAYYNALHRVSYSGTLELTEQESPDVRIGDFINVLASRTEWETMQVPVQEAVHRLFTGQTQLSFGPPEHLSIQDFFTKARIGRRRQLEVSFKPRDEAEDDTNLASDIGGYEQPKSNSGIKPYVPDEPKGFRVTVTSPGKITVAKGDLTEDGDAEHELDPGGERTVTTGGETLWAFANVDVDGGVTSVGMQWGSKPGGLKKHKPPKLDAPDSAGEPGKYAWKILEAKLTNGKIDVTYFRHGVEYYSDRANEIQLIPDPPIVNFTNSSGTGGDGGNTSLVIDLTANSSGICTDLEITKGGAALTSQTLFNDGDQIFQVNETSFPPPGAATTLARLLNCQSIGTPPPGDSKVPYRDSAGNLQAGNLGELPKVEEKVKGGTGTPAGSGQGETYHSICIPEGGGPEDNVVAERFGGDFISGYGDPNTAGVSGRRRDRYFDFNTKNLWEHDGSAWVNPDGTNNVESVNGATGTVILDAGDIGETPARVWLSPAEQAAIGSNTIARHSHGNFSLLESLTDAGSASQFLDGTGNYSTPSYPVTSVNGSTGTVVLDASNIGETTNRNWLTDAEQSAIAANTAANHSHANQSLLDSLTSAGSAAQFLDGTGNYSTPAFPVTSVNGATGVVNLEAANIPESMNRNWLTDAERTEIAANTAANHSHANQALLDSLTSSGSNTQFLGGDGNYSTPQYPVTTVNGQTGDVTISTTSNNFYNTNNAITGDRTVGLGGNTLEFSGDGAVRFNPNSGGSIGNLNLAIDELEASVSFGSDLSGFLVSPANTNFFATDGTTEHGFRITEDDFNLRVDREFQINGNAGTSGEVWTSNGPGTAPTYSPINFPVTSVNGETGVVALDASHLDETTTRKWLTDVERTAIAANTTDRHSHVNKTLLDTLTSGGAGDQFLANDGTYKTPGAASAPVDSVNGATGIVVLDAGDINPVTDRNWVTDQQLTDIGHANRTLLDSLTSGGAGDQFLANDGTYKTISSGPVSVTSVNGETGTVVIDAGDIGETATRLWLTPTERTNITNNATNSHTHSNKTLLDSLTSSGLQTQFLAGDGTYRTPGYPVTSVNGATGVIVLDAGDIGEITGRRWLTDIERTNITNNTTERHSHSNKTLLDNLTDGGAGDLFLSNDGTYKTAGAATAPVATVNGQTGTVILTADHINESTTRLWLTPTERTAITTNTTDRHTHANSTLLDSLTSSGSQLQFLAGDGTYRTPQYPVTTVNGSTGTVILNAGDINEVTNRNWLTDTERSAINQNTTDRHTHSNKTLLDTLTSGGAGDQFLANDGTYKTVGQASAPVDSVNGATGAVVLDAGDINEVTNRNWLTDTERSAINQNTSDRHSHSNKTLLDLLTDSGSASQFLAANGTYRTPNYPVTSVNGTTGVVTLTAANINESTGRNWLTDIERSAINQNTADRHSHSNKALLDNLTASGSQTQFLAGDGVYRTPAYPVSTVNGATGAVVLDAGDINEITNRRWMTDQERTDIGNIPLWWPNIAPADGTYTSFTVSGGSVTFNP